MKIDRLDLDGVGSPAGLAGKIHELLPDLQSIIPLEALCEQLDIVSIQEVETTGFEAALITDELKAQGAILLASGRHEARRRFSLAHELGHFLIPSHRPHPDRPFQCSLDDLHQFDAQDRDRRRRIEAEANRFAAHLLMPPALLRRSIAQSTSSLEVIVELAREFGVSKEAMVRAWVNAHPEPVAVVIAHCGRVRRCYRSEDFPWIAPTGGQPLPIGSLAAETVLAPGAFSPIEEVEPDVWLSERDAERTLVLTEQVLGQRDGYVLILLQAELDED